MAWLNTIFGDANARYLKTLASQVKKVEALEGEYKNFSDEQIKTSAQTLRAQFDAGKTLDDLLSEMFALTREAARRQLQQFHFPVQILGGIVLHQGMIAEMRTGEGKTLTATLPVALNALTGEGVHVVTVNDYLAGRDAAWMGQVYYVLGLSTAVIQHEASFIFDPSYEPAEDEQGKKFLRPCSRQDAYRADIAYGTNNEFGFDYLRDNLAPTAEQKVQRPLHYAIVDEVDSILIDEARTPLIISQPAEQSAELYKTLARIMPLLREEVHFKKDEKIKAIYYTEEGMQLVEQRMGKKLYTDGDVKDVFHAEQALKAYGLFHKDKDYVVKDGEIIIVDEFTGRLMPGRRYSEGLHQAIEAKEGVVVKEESQTLATISFQNLFRLYKKLSGMTGTAATEAEEFHKIYKLETVVVPTNKPMIRIDRSDAMFGSEEAKWQAVIKTIRERHEVGQPILVGTTSIEKNEKLSFLLSQAGLPFNMLNAKQHEREAGVIADAGKKGAITVATNMAGRGVDIILGGREATVEEQAEIKALGGLHIIGTERHESRRIDNQLRGRAGRQGDPGSSQFFLSLDDDLLRLFGSERLRRMFNSLGLPEDTPIEHKMVNKFLASAQRKVEAHNFDLRKHLVEYDDVVNKHRTVFYEKRNEVLERAARDLQQITGNTRPPEDNLKLKTLNLELSKLHQLISDYIVNFIAQFVNAQTAGEVEADWNYRELADVFANVSGLTNISPDTLKNLENAGGLAGKREAIREYLEILALAELNATAEKLDAQTLVYVERSVILRVMDMLWIDHLESMDHLRHGIGLRGYGQKDPLVEYQREGYGFFQQLLMMVEQQVAQMITRVIKAQAEANQNPAGQNVSLSGEALPPLPPGDYSKIGRNDPCPCGGGKKWKKCHGISL